MNGLENPLVQLVVILAALRLYYGFLVRAFDEPVARIVSRWLRSSRFSSAEVASVVDVGVAGIFQLAICVGLVLVLGLDFMNTFSDGFSGTRAILAVALGLAQAGASMFLSMALFTAAQAGGLISGKLSGTSRSMVHSGWVGSFVRIRRGLLGPFAILLTIFYVVTEEILFRGVVISAMDGWSPWVVALISTLLFMAAQTAGMPTLRHALFPLASSLVVGITNAYLILQGIDLLTLCIAHTTLFFVASRTGGDESSPVPIGAMS